MYRYDRSMSSKHVISRRPSAGRPIEQGYLIRELRKKQSTDDDGTPDNTECAYDFIPYEIGENAGDDRLHRKDHCGTGRSGVSLVTILHAHREDCGKDREVEKRE